MKIATIVGARPQFVKAAVVSRALRSQPGMREILIHTGQHYDENMSDVFFRELKIPKPDYELHIGSGSHGAQTGRMLEAAEAVVSEVKPDFVLVYGDTNSTLAGALAAVKLCVPVAHVEAGLRSFNRRMPEEINRVLTDHAADLLFAPTETALRNLLAEGIPPERIRVVGDVMYDLALLSGAEAEATSCILDRLGIRSKEYILATVHRAENTDDCRRLSAIFGGLLGVSETLPVVFPAHPRVRIALQRFGLHGRGSKAIHLIEPLGYLDMVMLEKHACLIATDSGGVQKEAFFQRVPCVTLRDETEWVELIELGWNHLVPPESADRVAAAILEALHAKGRESQPYGDGNASLRIATILSDWPSGGPPSAPHLQADNLSPACARGGE